MLKANKCFQMRLGGFLISVTQQKTKTLGVLYQVLIFFVEIGLEAF